MGLGSVYTALKSASSHATVLASKASRLLRLIRKVPSFFLIRGLIPTSPKHLPWSLVFPVFLSTLLGVVPLQLHSVLLCERSKMLPAFRTSEEVLKERMYILELIGFVTGTMGCIFLPTAIQHPDWRMWFNEKSSHYAAGVTQLGIWKICFPPNSKDFESLECCHGFDLFEEFFPLEMKVAQVLMFIGSFFAFVGLLLAFLIPWNSYFRQYVKTIFLPFMGGNFFLISSICVFVPITWNVYSILKDESISFPPSYHLPAKPISQRIGGAVYLGYMSSGVLLVSGFSVLFHVAQRTKLSNIFKSRRVLPV